MEIEKNTIMDIKFDICTDNGCNVTCTDVTEVKGTGNAYLPEDTDNVSYGRFRYSETGTISVLMLMSSDQYKTKLVQYTDHSQHEKGTRIKLPVKFDGLFHVFNIVLPTEDWVEDMAKNHPELLSLYDEVYYFGRDSYNNFAIFKKSFKNNTAIEAVDVEEVIERNRIGTTISMATGVHFSICFLTNCYLSLCQQIFENAAFSSCNSRQTVDSELAYRRDLVWMALNVIRYMVRCNMLEEAQRMIENISGCNGLCKGNYYLDNRKPGCGCGKGPRKGCGCR